MTTDTIIQIAALFIMIITPVIMLLGTRAINRENRAANNALQLRLENLRNKREDKQAEKQAAAMKSLDTATRQIAHRTGLVAAKKD